MRRVLLIVVLILLLPDLASAQTFPAFTPAFGIKVTLSRSWDQSRL